MAESIGIASFALQLAGIAMEIYKMTLNLRNNSKRCKTLGEDCQLLSEALSKYYQKRTSNDDEECKILQKLKDVLRRCLRYVVRTSANKFSYNLWEVLFVQEYEKLEDELAKYFSYFQLSIQIHTANASDDVKQITLENNSYIKDVRRIMDDKLKQEDFTKIFIKDLKLKPIENEPSKFRSDYKGQPVIASEVSYQISDNIDAAADPGSDSFHSIRRSVAILQKLANLGSVHGSYGLYRQNGRVYVVTEDLPCGSLTEVLKKGKLREKMKQKIEIAREIAYTLAYIHASGIIHKSICCDNIYMTKDLRPKVSNFVYGREIEERSSYIVTNSRYEPPEVLPPDAKEHTYLSDIWSYGALLWQLQTEKKPYSDDDDETAQHKIKNNNLFYMMNDDENLTICPKFNKLIEDCCAISPTDRPSISDIVRVLDDILADLIEQETMPTSDITTETPFNDPQEKEWTLTNAAAWHQKAEDVHKILTSLKNNNQIQSAGESDSILQDKKQLEQEYREYREKAFKCYQYCGSSTNDSRALYYTGLYLWRDYVKVEEDESEVIKDSMRNEQLAKKAMPYLQQASDLNNADAQYELATLYHKEYTELLKRSANQENPKGMFAYGQYLGSIGKKDEALNLIKKAAMAGNKRAQDWMKTAVKKNNTSVDNKKN